MLNKCLQWLDLNLGLVVSEVAALSTVSQPLYPNVNQVFVKPVLEQVQSTLLSADFLSKQKISRQIL